MKRYLGREKCGTLSGSRTTTKRAAPSSLCAKPREICVESPDKSLVASGGPFRSICCGRRRRGVPYWPSSSPRLFSCQPNEWRCRVLSWSSRRTARVRLRLIVPSGMLSSSIVSTKAAPTCLLISWCGSSNARITSERVLDSAAACLSSVRMSFLGSRTVIARSWPVGGRPRSRFLTGLFCIRFL